MILIKCDQDMNRMHYKGYGMIRDLFLEDIQEFFKLPKVSFEVCLQEFAKVDNYGKIKFESRTYSTSPSMAERHVMVKAVAYDIEIFDEGFNHIGFNHIIDKLVHHSHLLVFKGQSYKLTHSTMISQ